MTTEIKNSLVRPRINRREISESLAGRAGGDLGVDAFLQDVRCRARLVRAMPKSLQTLLVFSGCNGLLLVPYHPDSQRRVDCVMAPRELAMATWLGTVQPPPLTVPQLDRDSRLVGDDVSPRTSLQDAALGRNGIRQALSIEVHLKGEPAWQALCITGRTTHWGFGPLNENIELQRGGLLGLWALLRQVAIPPPAGLLGDAKVCESLASSDRIQNEAGSIK